MILTPAQAVEVRRCKQDFAYLQRTYLKLVDKDARKVLMRPNEAQGLIGADLASHLWLMYLKSRQLGCSAEAAAWFFWKAMFTPDVQVLVVAHHADSVKELFRKFYATFYTNLPDWMKAAFWLKGVRKGVPKNNEIHFFHGGRIVITSANSEKARTGTYNLLHLSEFSRYADLGATVAAILGTATPGAQVVFETTANGPNEAYEMWSGLGKFAQASRFHKRFIGWPMDERATGRRVSARGRYVVDLGVNETTGQRETFDVDFEDEPLSDEEAAYRHDHALTMEQMAWVRWALSFKCAGSWNTFNQEFPITADVAFILGGRSFFSVRYIEAMGGADKEGLVTVHAPQPFRTYVLGVDVASGSPDGNWSAAAMLDVTTESDLFEVATLGGCYPILEFARMVLRLAREYAAFVNVEANSYGAAVLEVLIEANYPYLSRRFQLNKVENKLEERVGFHTGQASRMNALSRLHDFLTRGVYKPQDVRIKRAINHFVYSDKGKPEAARGQRDDFVFAPAMAVVCLDQVIRHRVEAAQRRRPVTIPELLAWERATGRDYEFEADVFGDDSDESVADRIFRGPSGGSVMDLMGGVGTGGR